MDVHHIKGNTGLRDFEKMLKKAFGSKRKGITCDWKIKKNLELNVLYAYSWSNVILVMK
jgi:hypothetical protein